jgi:uncharacterized protein (TIGR02300 family)
MSVKAERGTKRTCQSTSCGARFYDLNRDPAKCPICGTVYELTAAPVMAAASTSRAPDPRKAAKKPVFVEEKQEDSPEVEAEEALVALEDVETPDAGAEADETFLEEEEEDGADMSNIIGGPVAEGEEQT